jgi:hypothetical protein
VSAERLAFVETYVQLWNQPDPVVRRQTVEALWATDGANYAQAIEAVGHDAIHDRVTRSYEKYVADGGHYFRAASAPVEHHGAIKVEWEMIDAASDSVAAVGLEFLLLDANAQIRSDHQFIVR